MIRLAGLLLIVACSAPRPTPPPVKPAAAYPAALYAGLFVQGATFRYELTNASSHNDKDDPDADPYGNVDTKGSRTMTCTVDDVQKLPGAIAASIECDTDLGVPVGGASPRGTYVATSTGLFRVDSIQDAGKLAARTALIPATPAEVHETKNGLDSRVERADGAWCVSATTSEGDDSGTQMCFAHGVLVSGYAYWAGGSSHEANYALVK